MVVKYVLSAHGSDNKTSQQRLTLNCTIFFYVKDNEFFESSNYFQTQTCMGETLPVESIIKDGYYPSSMLFTRNTDTTWKSGLVDCYSGHIVFNFDKYNRSLTLEYILDYLNNYHKIKYGLQTPFELHILSCRVTTGYQSKSEPRAVNVDSQTINRDFSSLFGNMRLGGNDNQYKQKYLKYKQKYLELKKMMNKNR